MKISKQENILCTLVAGIITNNRFLKESLYRNAGYLFGITIVNSAVGFLFWGIAARLYLQHEVGIGSSIVSVVQLLAGLANLGLGMGLVRFLVDSGDATKLLNSVINAVILLCFLVGGIYLVGIQGWSPALASIINTPWLYFGFLCFVVITGVNNILMPAFLSLRETKFAFWQMVVMNSVRLGLVIAFVQMNFMGIFLSVFIAFIVADLLSLFIFLPIVSEGYRYKPDLSIPVIQKILPFSAGNYIADFLARAPMYVVPPLVLEILGSEASAQAYIAWMMGAFLNSPGLSLSNSAFAEGAYQPEELSNITFKAMRTALIITIPISLIVGLGAEYLLGFFGQEYTNGAADLLRWLAVAAPFASISGVYFSVLRVKTNVKMLIGLSIVLVIFSIIIPAILLDTFGLTANGIGWLIAHVLITLRALFQYSGGKL